MPGQRKRKRRQQAERERAAARFAPGAGHWEVLFTTQDESRWRAYVERLRASASASTSASAPVSAASSETGVDWPAMRVDVLCGRLVQPTTYRLSRFVPGPEGD
ncbi:hypothetical protein ACIA6C_10560 [Streptomyces sp. NPDC051578]|uniref:hypothetical protein n=1 Tax=Streptomyces sp. NPDC051578 TaxID=3365662 RepID=UPI0037A43DCB